MLLIILLLKWRVWKDDVWSIVFLTFQKYKGYLLGCSCKYDIQSKLLFVFTATWYFFWFKHIIQASIPYVFM